MKELREIQKMLLLRISVRIFLAWFRERSKNVLFNRKAKNEAENKKASQKRRKGAAKVPQKATNAQNYCQTHKENKRKHKNEAVI